MDTYDFIDFICELSQIQKVSSVNEWVLKHACTFGRKLLNCSAEKRLLARGNRIDSKPYARRLG